MKKEENTLHKFNSISDAHKEFGLPKPKHPLISLLHGNDANPHFIEPSGSHVLNFYKISYKPMLNGKLRYGLHHYDFEGGGLLFAAPHQIMGSSHENNSETTPCSIDSSVYTLLIHPDFLLSYPLAKKIKQYNYFSYAVNEALHLSEAEKETIISVFKMIETELNSRIDDFSQDVVVSQIEVLLNFANRFYKRQFITRKAANNDLLQKLEEILIDYFNNETALRSGVPTVAYLAGQLNLSPSYLSDMLRSLTGRNAQQHIHDKVIEKAKEILSTTNLSVGEVAYALGFEYSQSFSKLFKSKTNFSPLEFRQQFN
ncbi:helix-turn-helix domain-containing protein [Chryseolinea lacunae]|uniref:Helix-turn-helix transcriptional regulator n=1 Tax=Chryseolinea lacunae TaxID=2801331 RepID=A0ABS1KUK2_9BACT|nr:AraC family transcriptional regulator [Chryseolinea lacunae]MBL0743015.1 helix-turn-helix transcriptional regulator [Chryseolinea lacunae]